VCACVLCFHVLLKCAFFAARSGTLPRLHRFVHGPSGSVLRLFMFSYSIAPGDTVSVFDGSTHAQFTAVNGSEVTVTSTSSSMTIAFTSTVGGRASGTEGWMGMIDFSCAQGVLQLFTGDECPAGLEGSGVVCVNGSLTGCSACRLDSFKASAGPGNCTSCAFGSTTNGASGQVGCVCSAGFAGTWSLGNSGCFETTTTTAATTTLATTTTTTSPAAATATTTTTTTTPTSTTTRTSSTATATTTASSTATTPTTTTTTTTTAVPTTTTPTTTVSSTATTTVYQAGEGDSSSSSMLPIAVGKRRITGGRAVSVSALAHVIHPCPSRCCLWRPWPARRDFVLLCLQVQGRNLVFVLSWLSSRDRSDHLALQQKGAHRKVAFEEAVPMSTNPVYATISGLQTLSQ
jgi:hypothetical protein